MRHRGSRPHRKVSISKGLASETSRGVLRLMQQPGVLQAVLLLTECSPAKEVSAMDSGGGGSADGGRAAAPGKEAMGGDERAPSRQQGEKEDVPPAVEEEPQQQHRKDSAPAKTPTIEAMREVGYLGTAQTLKATWAWAREQGALGAVWPTPVAGMQEAVRFDACGWPHAESTPEEWLNVLSYWTALREQLIGGASRSQRNAVERATRWL